LFQFVGLALARSLRGRGGGQRGAGGFALGLQGVEFILLAAQRGFGGRGVQRFVGGHGRVLVRAAQRAGLAGLQCVAVLGQALDTLLLQEQGLLVRDLFLDALVLLP